jgi:hypothetical protein
MGNIHGTASVSFHKQNVRKKGCGRERCCQDAKWEGGTHTTYMETTQMHLILSTIP